jgi:hypothetical protein
MLRTADLLTCAILGQVSRGLSPEQVGEGIGQLASMQLVCLRYIYVSAYRQHSLAELLLASKHLRTS